mmetsp:Transcript_13106/g.51283  ORF Transcript_13106/g.51283 Transcript_13106/m.51283 type:complete len:335 (+) Transcript_13106:980-1984(+)
MRSDTVSELVRVQVHDFRRRAPRRRRASCAAARPRRRLCVAAHVHHAPPEHARAHLRHPRAAAAAAAPPAHAAEVSRSRPRDNRAVQPVESFGQARHRRPVGVHRDEQKHEDDDRRGEVQRRGQHAEVVHRVLQLRGLFLFEGARRSRRRAPGRVKLKPASREIVIVPSVRPAQTASSGGEPDARRSVAHAKLPCARRAHGRRRRRRSAPARDRAREGRTAKRILAVIPVIPIAVEPVRVTRVAAAHEPSGRPRGPARARPRPGLRVPADAGVPAVPKPRAVVLRGTPVVTVTHRGRTTSGTGIVAPRVRPSRVDAPHVAVPVPARPPGVVSPI